MTSANDPLGQILASLTDLQQQNVILNQKAYFPFMFNRTRRLTRLFIVA